MGSSYISEKSRSVNQVSPVLSVAPVVLVVVISVISLVTEAYQDILAPSATRLKVSNGTEALGPRMITRGPGNQSCNLIGS